MKKIFGLISVLMVLQTAQAAFAEVGYVDYSYISKNYPLAVKYNSTLKSKSQAIRTYAEQKDAQVAKAQTQAEKQKIKKEGIAQVQLKQQELNTLRAKYENELNSNVRAASEQVRVKKNLDMIIKGDARITGGVNCTNDVLMILKSQSAAR